MTKDELRHKLEELLKEVVKRRGTWDGMIGEKFYFCDSCGGVRVSIGLSWKALVFAYYRRGFQPTIFGTMEDAKELHDLLVAELAEKEKE